MSGNNNLPSLEMEIHALRQKLKSSNHETVEECERLRAEIQQLYFQLARITRPGRYAGKRKNKRDINKKNKVITPEVIPPDLDLSGYLDSEKETASTADTEDSISTAVHLSSGENSAKSTDKSSVEDSLIPYEPRTKISLFDSYTLSREKTIEERFSVIAERMQERKQNWQESQEKKRPWWKPY